ncbi:MAG: hypothetical protein ACT4QD_20200 [Acidobacteriota bacterium]
MTLFEMVESEGAAAAVAKYRELRRDMTSGKYNFGEWEINELGRRLTEAGNTAAAIAIFEMNGEFYQESSAIDFSLAELHRGRGERDKAIARYRATRTRSPDHQGARRWLSELLKQ